MCKIYTNRPFCTDLCGTASTSHSADAFRRQNKTSYPPRNNVARSVGTVTIDNVDYGRYMGELQIDLCPLPADPRVNVVAQVCEPDLALLPYAADPAYQFEFCE